MAQPSATRLSEAAMSREQGVVAAMWGETTSGGGEVVAYIELVMVVGRLCGLLEACEPPPNSTSLAVAGDWSEQ